MRFAIKILFLIALSLTSQSLQAQSKLTAEEQRAAAVLSAKFREQWEADGNMKRIVAELYAPDFMERFLEQERLALKEEASTASMMFLPGMRYQSELLTTASVEDWRNFYASAHELFFTFGTIGLNHTAGALLQGKEPNSGQLDKMLERVIPARMRTELMQDSCLRDLVDGENAAPIATVEDLHRVTALLERTIDAIRQERGASSHQLTQVAHKLLTKQALAGADKPVVEIQNEPFLGLPASTRVVCVPLFEMFHLMFAKIDGEYRILCVHPLGD